MSLGFAACGLGLVLACASRTEPTASPTTGLTPALSSQSASDLSTWSTYANRRFELTLRYPPDYAATEIDTPSLPARVLRLALQPVSLRNPTGLEPPAFAVDVYDNVSRQSLSAWLTGSGLVAGMRRPTQDAVQVGGVPGVRVIDQILLAPNTFYFVARGQFIYRFTPLGPYSDQILDTVRFGS